jgi:hypothetical protein
MLGASVLPTERIAHVGAGELAALRDFTPAYVGSGFISEMLGRLNDFRSASECVAKLFSRPEGAILIQGRAQARNVDSKTPFSWIR